MRCNRMSRNPPPVRAKMSDLESLGRIMPVSSTFSKNHKTTFARSSSTSQFMRLFATL